MERYLILGLNSKYDNDSSGSNLSTLLVTFSLNSLSGRSLSIINYHESNKNLNESSRNLLVYLIIVSLLEEKSPMSTTLANYISSIIIGTYYRNKSKYIS